VDARRQPRRHRHIARKRNATEGDPPVLAGDEADLDVADDDDATLGSNRHQLVVGHAAGPRERACARGAEDLGAGAHRDPRRVEQVIVVAVATDDRVDSIRHMSRDRRLVRDEALRRRAHEAGPGEERIDQQGRRFRLDHVPRGPEPPHAHALARRDHVVAHRPDVGPRLPPRKQARIQIDATHDFVRVDRGRTCLFKEKIHRPRPARQ
jgi:hypothetical protein